MHRPGVRIDMSPTEASVAAVFALYLKSENLNLDDDVFALGGDSMQAVTIAMRLEEDFQVELPLEMLEDAASISAIAAFIDAELAARAKFAGAPP